MKSRQPSRSCPQTTGLRGPANAQQPQCSSPVPLQVSPHQLENQCSGKIRALGRGSRSKGWVHLIPAGFPGVLLAPGGHHPMSQLPCLGGHPGAASLGKDCGCACRGTARDGRALVVKNLPITTSPPAHQSHHEGDSLAGDTFHHQEMLVSQHLSSGKEKRQQWKKAGTQLGTLLIN